MGYPLPPQWPPPPAPPPPPRNAGDVTASVIVMVMTALLVAGGAVMGFFSLAFLDYCPPATCSADAAVVAAMTTVGIAAVVAVAGIITTIIRLVARKKAWPFAVGTLTICLGVFFLGAMAYTAAVS